jgi:hypothetical protein
VLIVAALVAAHPAAGEPPPGFVATGPVTMPGAGHARRPIPVGSGGVITRPAAEPFSIFVLPDTQGYADGGCYAGGPCFDPRAFEAQTRYIRRSYDHPDNNAIFVAHLGDVVDDAARAVEWKRAQKAMRALGGIPHGVAPGNHDFIGWCDGKARPRAFGRHFPLATYKRQSPGWRAWLRSSYRGLRNTLHLFSAGGDRYAILFLEFCPDARTLAWARGQLRRHRARRAIVVTHAAADRRGAWIATCPAQKPGHAGQALWDRLVRPAPSVDFLLCGHAGGYLGWNAWRRKWTRAGRLTAWWREHGWDGGTYVKRRAADGHTVHVLISNYQHHYRAGHGLLRRMRFVPRRGEVEIVTWSPHARRFLRDEEPRCAEASYVNDPGRAVVYCNNFTLRYRMSGAGAAASGRR